MGLNATAKGLTSETEFECGYFTFGNFRMQLAYAYNQELGEIYEKIYQHNFTEQDIARWNEICNDDLDIFLWHSDCDGSFTWQECRKIYKAIKGISLDMPGHNYCVMKNYNMLEHWKNIFNHCAKRRVKLYFR